MSRRLAATPDKTVTRKARREDRFRHQFQGRLHDPSAVVEVPSVRTFAPLWTLCSPLPGLREQPCPDDHVGRDPESPASRRCHARRDNSHSDATGCDPLCSFNAVDAARTVAHGWPGQPTFPDGQPRARGRTRRLRIIAPRDPSRTRS